MNFSVSSYFTVSQVAGVELDDGNRENDKVACFVCLFFLLSFVSLWMVPG